MSQSLPFHIAQPCHESWQQMTADNGGRHCAQCCKTVIDFSEWETTDIVQYLRTNAGTCGRFKKSQLNIPQPPQEEVVRSIWRSGMQIAYKVAATVLLFFSVGFSSCVTDSKNSSSQTAQVADTPTKAVIVNDPSSMIMGEIIKIDTATMKKHAPANQPKKKQPIKKVSIAQPVMGESEYVMGAPPEMPQADTSYHP